MRGIYAAIFAAGVSVLSRCEAAAATKRNLLQLSTAQPYTSTDLTGFTQLFDVSATTSGAFTTFGGLAAQNASIARIAQYDGSASLKWSISISSTSTITGIALFTRSDGAVAYGITGRGGISIGTRPCVSGVGTTTSTCVGLFTAAGATSVTKALSSTGNDVVLAVSSWSEPTGGIWLSFVIASPATTLSGENSAAGTTTSRHVGSIDPQETIVQVGKTSAAEGFVAAAYAGTSIALVSGIGDSTNIKRFDIRGTAVSNDESPAIGIVGKAARFVDDSPFQLLLVGTESNTLGTNVMLWDFRVDTTNPISTMVLSSFSPNDVVPISSNTSAICAKFGTAAAVQGVFTNPTPNPSLTGTVLDSAASLTPAVASWDFCEQRGGDTIVLVAGLRVYWTPICSGGQKRANMQCDQCTAGKFSRDKFSAECLDCDIGYGSAAGSSSCTRCGVGQVNPNAGGTCTNCAAGQQANAGRVTCESCAAGKSSTAGSACADCAAGTRSGPGSASCTPCAQGTYNSQAGQATCDPCPQGKYGSKAGGTSVADGCADCPAGSYGGTTGLQSAAACTACGAGSFGSSAGATTSTVCQQCAAGKYGPTAVASTCTDCAQGKYSAQAGQTAESTCTNCAAGKYGSAAGGSAETICTQCPAGTQQPNEGASGSTACAPCAYGKYGLLPGASTCTDCPAGQSTLTTGATSNLDCRPCPKGTYLGAAGQCVACAAGKWSSAEGATSEATCVSCAAGKYGNGTGRVSEADACVSCPAGRYSTAAGGGGVDSCTLCAAGKASAALGATSATTCTDCVPGNAAGEGSASCTPCTVGKFAPNSAMGACTNCPAGKYGSSTSGLRTTEATSCTNCAQGKFSATLGATSSALCQDCPIGTYGEAAGLGSEGACSACAVGKYGTAAGSTSDAVCASCPEGTFNALTGRGALADCLACPAGKHGQGVAQSDCRDCAAGTYNPTVGAANSTFCVGCPAGKFGVLAGAPALANCTDCPAGSYSTAIAITAAGSCSSCPAGTSSADTGATSNNTCIPCSRGYYTTSPRSSSCSACDAGKYGTMLGGSSPATACESCPAGYNSSAPGASSSAACAACPTGYFSAPGSALCTPCAAGKYNPLTNQTSVAACLNCPPGKYNPTVGAGSIQHCVDCPRGKSSYLPAQPSEAACAACPPGRIAANPGSTSCTPCLPPTFADTSYSCAQCPVNAIRSSQGDACATQCAAGSIPNDLHTLCELCAVGKYAPVQGTATCVPCAAGTFRGAVGGLECTLCPVGQYVNATGASACTACPAGRTTLSAGQTLQSSCYCRDTTFSLAVNDPTAACRACPEGAKCTAGRAPSAEVGYYYTLATPEVFFPCSPPAACPGGDLSSRAVQGVDLSLECVSELKLLLTKAATTAPSCPTSTGRRLADLVAEYGPSMNETFMAMDAAGRPVRRRMQNVRTQGPKVLATPCATGYTDNRCSLCAQGFYRLGSNCRPCPDYKHLFLILFVVGLFGAMAFSSAILRTGVNLAAMTIAYDFFQVLGKFSKFDLEWSGTISSVLGPLSLTEFDLDIAAPSCFVDTGYTRKWLVINALPLIVFGILLIYHLSFVAYAKCKSLPAIAIREHMYRRVGEFSLMLQVLYLVLVSKTIEVFDCKLLPDGTRELEADPSMRCWSSDHVALVLLGFVSGGLYVAGIPLGIFFLLRWAKNEAAILHEAIAEVDDRADRIMDAVERERVARRAAQTKDRRFSALRAGHGIMAAGLIAGAPNVAEEVAGGSAAGDVEMVSMASKPRSLKDRMKAAARKAREEAAAKAEAEGKPAEDLREKSKRRKSMSSDKAEKHWTENEDVDPIVEEVLSRMMGDEMSAAPPAYLTAMVEMTVRRRMRFLELLPEMSEEESKALYNLATVRSELVAEFALIDKAVGSVYKRFRLEKYYWLLCIFLRKIGIVLFFVILTSRPMVSSALVALVIVVSLRYHIQHKPYAPFDAPSSFRTPTKDLVEDHAAAAAAVDAAGTEHSKNSGRASADAKRASNARSAAAAARMLAHSNSQQARPMSDAVSAASAVDAPGGAKHPARALDAGASAEPGQAAGPSQPGKGPALGETGRSASAAARGVEDAMAMEEAAQRHVRRSVVLRSASVRGRALQRLEEEELKKERARKGDKTAELALDASRGSPMQRLRYFIRRTSSDPNLLEAVALLSAVLVLFAGQIYHASRTTAAPAASTADSSQAVTGTSTSSHPSLLSYRGLSSTVVVDVVTILIVLTTTLVMVLLVGSQIRIALLALYVNATRSRCCCRSANRCAERLFARTVGLTQDELEDGWRVPTKKLRSERGATVELAVLAAWAPQKLVGKKGFAIAGAAGAAAVGGGAAAYLAVSGTGFMDEIAGDVVAELSLFFG